MTLFFEDSDIRLLSVADNKVEQWASTTLEKGLISDGIVRDELQVAEKLKELFTLNNIKKGNVTVGLRVPNSLYRLISLPKMPKGLLAEAVRREAGRLLPISLDDQYLSYQLLPGSGDENQVFVSVFPKDAVDVLYRTMRKFGININVLDMAPLALARLVNEPRSIIVDARLDYLDIIVMVNRVPQVIRSLALHTDAKSVEENIPTISEELSRTVAFYNAGHQGDPLGVDVPVIVSGEISDPDLRLLAGGYSVRRLSPEIDFPAGLPVPDFVVNIGLALRELSAKKEGNYSLVNFNALPAKYLPSGPNPLRIAMPVATILAVGFLVWTWYNLQTDTKITDQLNAQIAPTNRIIDQNNKDVANLMQQERLLQLQITPLNAVKDSLQNQLDNYLAIKTQFYAELGQIMQLKPVDVVLTSVSDQGGNNPIPVTGRASNLDSIFTYAAGLRDKAGFSVLVASIVERSEVTIVGEKTEQYDFSFQLSK